MNKTNNIRNKIIKNINKSLYKIFLLIFIIIIGLLVTRKIDSYLIQGDLQDILFKKKYEKRYDQEVLYKNIKDFSVDENIITSTSTDPWIYLDISGIGIFKYIKIDIDLLDKQNREAQFFYATKEKGFNENDSKRQILKNGINYIKIPQEAYTSIRLDLTYIKEDSFYVKYVELTNKFIPRAIDLLKIILLNIIWCGIWYIIIFSIFKDKWFTNIVYFIVKYRFIISICVFSLLVLFEFHGASIDYYNYLIPDKHIKKSYISPVFGKIRAIRSDEYLVNTPITFSQIMNNYYFPLQNKNISLSGVKLFQYNIPVFSLNLLAQPSLWGYFFLGKSRGLSWFWWSRFFFILLSSFEICMFLTNKNKTISIIGGLLITFAPPVQWWYSTTLVDIIYYGQFLFISILYYIKNINNIKIKILFATLAFISASGFCMCLYPPFLIPMGYTIIALLISLFLIYYKKIEVKKNDIIIVFITVFLTIILIGYTFFENYDHFKITMNTVYPGMRSFLGGGLDFKLLLTDITCWLLPYKDVSVGSNSGDSRFITFLPLILFLGPFMFSKENNLKKIQIVLYSLLIIQLAWFAKLFPPFLSKITLLSMVSPNRAIVISGLLVTYLGLSLFSSVTKEKPIKLSIGIFISIIICILYNYSITSIPWINEYLGNLHIITILFFMIYNFIFIMGYKKLFYILSCVIIALSIPVNPLARGIDSIYNKNITHEIQTISKEEPDKWWITPGFNSGGYLAAIGVKTLSAVNFVPDFEKYKILDPDEKYIDIYNRYAHQNYIITEEKTSFILNQTDLISIYINKYDLLRLNIGFVFTENGNNLSKYNDLSRFNDEKIQFEPIFSNQHFVIYKVTS